MAMSLYYPFDFLLFLRSFCLCKIVKCTRFKVVIAKDYEECRSILLLVFYSHFVILLYLSIIHKMPEKYSDLLTCAKCGKDGNKKCSKCFSVSYCSRQCQVSDWPRHKGLCMPVMVRDLGDKGRGLVASRDFKAGDLIFEENTIVKDVSDNLQFVSKNISLYGKRIVTQLSKLSESTQKDFLNLTRKQKVMDDESIIPEEYRIAFAIYVNNSIAGNLFLDLSLINHSCVPNTMWWMKSEQSQQEIQELRAIREIKAGEELTASYLDTSNVFLKDKQEKRNELFRGWNFLCECPSCVKPEDESHTKLRGKLQVLYEKRDLLISKDPSIRRIKIQNKISLLTDQIVDGIIELDEPSIFLNSWLQFKMLYLSGHETGRSDMFEKGKRLFKECVETGKFTEALNSFKTWKETLNFK